MRGALVVLALSLTACGAPQQTPTTTTEQPAVVPAGDVVGGDVIQGPFEAMSRTAMGITGDMSFSDGDVSFMNGILLRTTHIETYSAFDPMAASGDLFDLAAPGDDDRTVDLRRVDAQEITDDERSQGGLCGAGRTPTYIALVHDQPVNEIAVVAFFGADAPGRNATNSEVCAVFSYARGG